MAAFTLNGIHTEFSDEFNEMSAQKRKLDQIKEPTELLDAATIAALYDDLADRFETDLHKIVAGNCRKNADKWKARIPK